MIVNDLLFFFFFKQKTAYEMRISDWSSDVCSSDLIYGQINYHLTDRLRATGGLCYTWDSRKLVLHTRLDRDTLECAIPADQRDIPGGACDRTRDKIGRASCRERVCQYV